MYLFIFFILIKFLVNSNSKKVMSFKLKIEHLTHKYFCFIVINNILNVHVQFCYLYAIHKGIVRETLV